MTVSCWTGKREEEKIRTGFDDGDHLEEPDVSGKIILKLI